MGRSSSSGTNPGNAPISDDPHRRVEIALRLALERLREGERGLMALDSHFLHLVGSLIFSVDAAHSSFCKTYAVNLEKTELEWREKDASQRSLS